MEKYIDGHKSKIALIFINNCVNFIKFLNKSDQMLNIVKIIFATLLSILFGYFFEIQSLLILEFILLLNGTFIFYNILYYVMNKYVKSFKEIYPEHKKMYVIKNFTKSIMLAILSIKIPSNIVDVFNGNCDLYFIKKCAIHYVINDIVGLLIVKKLPTTTKIHHITTTIFAFLTLLKTKNTIDIITLIEIYALFSALAFCVNFYLGFRIFPANIIIKKYLSLLSFVVYVITCFFNWSVQMYLLYKLFFVSITQVYIYLIFFFSVARDDIILMKWLYNDYNTIHKIDA